MELFVVNRYDDKKESTENEEHAKLQKVLKRIEKNKATRQKRKEKESKQKTARQYTELERKFKRENKAKLVPVPENNIDEFVDKDVVIEPTENDVNKTEESSKQSKHRSKKQKLDPSAIEGFTILGADNFEKKTQVKRVLPKWLSHPTVISVNLQNLQSKVSEVKELDKTLKKLLKANGVKFFFPVQATVIPWLIKVNKHSDIIFPRDICVSAPTGSGKTLAFVLPVIQALKVHTVKQIRALVILPTQDLATQVFKSFKMYSQNTNLDVCLVTGKNSFEVEQKQLVTEIAAFGIVSKIDILICTAGRLVDHLKTTKGFNLQHLEFLIIDEADRVLDSVQNDWLYHLEKHIYQEEQNGRILNLFTLQKRRPPQKLLFSATLSQDPEKLQKLSLFQPKLFTSIVENSETTTNSEQINTETFIGKYTTPKELTEKYIVTSMDLKPLVLYKFIKNENLTKTLVFTHSIDSAHRLMILLKSLFKNELKIEEISSHLQVKNRNDLIAKFSVGEIDLLVCTDALARGIDLPGVQCVINYSAPKHLKTYIHRAGRTARAGENGLAITLLHKTQLFIFKSLLKQADKMNVEELSISEEDLEPLGEQYKQSLEELKKTVEKEEKQELEKSKSAKRKNNKRKRKHSVTSNNSL